MFTSRATEEDLPLQKVFEIGVSAVKQTALVEDRPYFLRYKTKPLRMVKD